MRVFVSVLLFAYAMSGLSCGPTGSGDLTEVVEQPIDGFTAVDLISPATCRQQNGKLLQCTIAPVSQDVQPIDTAVPLRTVVQRTLTGNCSTQFPLSVAIALDGAAPASLAFLSQSQLTLRRSDGGPVQRVTVTDSSSWTSTVVFADTCRVSATITSNQVDVDTTQQAEALLAVIDQELAGAQRDVRNYETLLALQSAYAFTRSVASSFHQELTSETMQVLRRAAIAAAPAMQIAALGCGDALSQEQRETLFQLVISMVALGDPAAWLNPDGTTKTLEQFYGAGAAEVLAQLEVLAGQADPDLETEFHRGLDAAALEVVRLQQKRSLAVQQLAPWLGGVR